MIKVINVHKLCKIADVKYSRANKALYFDKPFFLTEDEREALIDASKKAHENLIKLLS